MQDGRHERLPASELASFKRDLEDEARLRRLDLSITVTDHGDGTVDVAWTVRPASGRAAAGVLAGAAGGAAAGAAAGGPVGAAIGAVAGAVAGAAFAGPSTHRLGKLSEKFETSGRGPGTVSSGTGDAGGASYGLYQMTSRDRSGVGGTVARFIAEASFPHAARFAGQTPGSAEFTATWKALAAEDPDGFGALQHAYIERTHYAPVVQGLQRESRLDLATRSAALRDVVWSTAVQHGPGTPIVGRCCAALLAGGMQPDAGKAFDKALIEAIYAERGRRDANGTLVWFSRNSPQVQDGVAKRFVNECADALKMLANGS